MTYDAELEAYMTATTPERYMIETSYGLVQGIDSRPRFEMAMCTQCRRFVDVLPTRIVTAEQRAEWKWAMTHAGYRVVGEYYRLRYREGCGCENVQEDNDDDV